MKSASKKSQALAESPLERRTFLKGALCLVGLGTWHNAFSSMAETNRPETLYASAFTHLNGQHAIALFNETGHIHWTLPLKERAHAPIFHPNNTLVGVVARRPGFYLELYDILSAKMLTSIKPEKDHHFYGHGVFTTDGSLLLTTENHYPSGTGKIFIRDWQNNNVVKQFPSYGIGPHELHLLDNNTLVVANGGLQTHPDNGRKILNLDTMAPSLAFIDIKTGKLIKKLTLQKPWQQLSIRHIDINLLGDIVLGFQYQGASFDEVPLIGKASIKDSNIEIMTMPETIRQRFQQYCGSVTLDKTGQLLAASSPRGGLVAYWDIQSNTFLGHHNYRDVCGIAPTANANQFLLTTGQGKRIFVNPVNDEKIKLKTTKQYHWDNHIHRILS